jgi:hypothetical protein
MAAHAATPVLRRLRQEDQEFQDILDYKVRLHLKTNRKKTKDFKDEIFLKHFKTEL